MIPRRTEPLTNVITGLVLYLFGYGLIIMFLSATIDKQFDVWSAMGYLESLAWSAGLFIVRDMVSAVRG